MGFRFDVSNQGINLIAGDRSLCAGLGDAGTQAFLFIWFALAGSFDDDQVQRFHIFKGGKPALTNLALAAAPDTVAIIGGPGIENSRFGSMTKGAVQIAGPSKQWGMGKMPSGILSVSLGIVQHCLEMLVDHGGKM
jgi:hypothetical protein